MDTVHDFVEFLRANPQVAVLLFICLVLGIGTFIVVLIGIASSGSTVTNGYPSDVIWGLKAPLG